MGSDLTFNSLVDSIQQVHKQLAASAGRIVPTQLGSRIPDIQSLPEKVRTTSAQLAIPPKKLVERLSYSHLELLIGIDDDLKRTFYEVECINGNWSVRELKRQIVSLYYERSGLSKDRKKRAELVKSHAQQAEPKLAVRNPYIFEFLGLKPREVLSESDLEESLLNKLQEFLLELGGNKMAPQKQEGVLRSFCQKLQAEDAVLFDLNDLGRELHI